MNRQELIEKKRQEWQREMDARVENTDDEILKLAEEIYVDMKETLIRRVRGERQKGALVGLGFEGWMGPWGGWSDPKGRSAINRIMNSLRHKPYFSRLEKIGISRHPQRKVELRGEWLKPYFNIDINGNINWGLEKTREYDEVFAAKYDFMYLKVLNDGDIVAKIESEKFDNTNSLAELKLDDDDYRFEVGCAAHHWSRFSKSFDYAIIDGEWRQLEPQGRNWDGEWEGSTRVHTGEISIEEPTAAERAREYFAMRKIERENETYGPHADRYSSEYVQNAIARSEAKGDNKAANFWRIIKRIQDDRVAAAEIPAEETVDEVITDPKDEIITFIKSIRDNPPNTAVRGNPHHIRKWNRVLATLDVDTGETPFTPSEIRVRAEKWPCPWARVVPFLGEN